MTPEIFNTLNEIFQAKTLLLGVLSAPKEPEKDEKISIRPIQIKEKTYYQVTITHQSKTTHKNYLPLDCCEWLQKQFSRFKQIYLYTQSADYHLLIGKKGNISFLKKPPTKSPKLLVHNRPKAYLLQEGEPIPFLVHLGVMSSEGKVYPAKRDKFRQINRFVEIIRDLIPHLNSFHRLRIVDFGCGKAYLTFALYHFLKICHGYPIHITGLDLKEELIEKCRELANSLGYQEDLEFLQGDIRDYQSDTNVDLMISLHACDTATDAALMKAIEWNAKVILCVPCCQHELFSQIKQETLRPLLKHGILKERFAALVTDAARSQLLEVLGYRTQVFEFIDLEHTPKNLLIQAVKNEKGKNNQEALDSYLTFKKTLQINPYFEKILTI